jgi:hypothetical protein
MNREMLGGRHAFSTILIDMFFKCGRTYNGFVAILTMFWYFILLSVVD